MSSFVVKNNVESLVVDNPLAQAATTLNITAASGSSFPSTFPFLITIWDDSAHPDPTDDAGMEIVRCTGRSTDALTIVRAQEGTGDVAHTLGERVAMLITAGVFNDATYGVSAKLDGITAGAIADIVEDTTPQLGGTLDSNSKQIRWSKGSDVASANALTLGDDGNYFDITGTTAITSIATKGIGPVVILHFDGILTLTHNATDLILPSGANITTAAGDEAMFVEYASGDWRCISYMKASGDSVIGGAGDKKAIAWLGAEGAYLPDTNPAALTEVVGSGTYGGWSYLAFDDTTSEHAMWRVPMPDYDGGNIVVTAFSKPATTPAGAVTLQFNIYTIGLANSEAFNSAVTVDTTVNISQAMDTTELNTDVCVTSATIDPANVAADDLMVIELNRDVSNDNLTGDGQLVGILLEYMRT